MVISLLFALIIVGILTAFMAAMFDTFNLGLGEAFEVVPAESGIQRQVA